MASVFISYSSKDRKQAQCIAELLIEGHHQVWFDEWSIDPGESIPIKIQSGIEDADFVVVLLSQHAVESRWVEREWMMAYWDSINANHVRLIPVLLSLCRLPKFLETIKYIDCCRDWEEGCRQLLKSIMLL